MEKIKTIFYKCPVCGEVQRKIGKHIHNGYAIQLLPVMNYPISPIGRKTR